MNDPEDLIDLANQTRKDIERNKEIKRNNVEMVMNTASRRRIELIKKSFSGLRLAISTLSNDLWETNLMTETKLSIINDLNIQKISYNELEIYIINTIEKIDDNIRQFLNSSETFELD